MTYTRKIQNKIKVGGNTDEAIVSVFLTCYNEERIIDFTINYYKRQFPNCIITICDNESTDRSVEIAKKLGCNIHTFSTDGIYNEDKLVELRNTLYKDAKTRWVIVCDMDEILTANQKDILDEQEKGVTILKTKGYDVIGKSKKNNISNIKSELNSLTRGEYKADMSKSVCFDRTKIIINFGPGSHDAKPTGDIKYSEKEYMLYHYKKLGLEYYKYTHKRVYNRSAKSRNKGFGVHYTNNQNRISTAHNETKLKIENIPPLKSFYLK